MVLTFLYIHNRELPGNTVMGRTHRHTHTHTHTHREKSTVTRSVLDRLLWAKRR